MAYRKLEVNDAVRITGSSSSSYSGNYHGYDGTVIEVLDHAAKVRFYDSRAGHGTSKELWFYNLNLVILASTPIKDKEIFMTPVMDTPVQRAGYKVGDKFRVIGRGDTFRQGAIITLHYDDGSSSPLFSGKREDTSYSAADGPGAYISLSSIERFVEPEPLKVGDTVRILPVSSFGATTFYSTHVGKIGVITHLDKGSSLDVLVEFADGISDWGRSIHVEVVKVEQVVAPAPDFKVGDRVKVIKHTGRGFDSDVLRKVGTITRTDSTSLPVLVQFDDGEEDWGKFEELELVVGVDVTTLKQKLEALEALVADLKVLVG